MLSPIRSRQSGRLGVIVEAGRHGYRRLDVGCDLRRDAVVSRRFPQRLCLEFVEHGDRGLVAAAATPAQDGKVRVKPIHCPRLSPLSLLPRCGTHALSVETPDGYKVAEIEAEGGIALGIEVDVRDAVRMAAATAPRVSHGRACARGSEFWDRQKSDEADRDISQQPQRKVFDGG